MTIELRRFPRIAASRPARVLFAESDAALEIEIQNLSCEGAGVCFPPTDQSLSPGARVRIAFSVPDGNEVEFAARVVWAAAGKAGLRLLLEAGEGRSKQTYGQWIAPLTKTALADRPKA